MVATVIPTPPFYLTKAVCGFCSLLSADVIATGNLPIAEAPLHIHISRRCEERSSLAQ